MTDELNSGQYRDLAELRRQIRRFIHFSESAAREQGIEAAQHQLLLAVEGLPEGVKPTIRELAARLFIQHHSAVELIDRMETSGTVKRSPGPDDRREVWIHLTDTGRALLHRLTVAHRNELEHAGPELAHALNAVLRHSRTAMAATHGQQHD
jgi:DNA-binding MarR family transcriptional regulator